MSRCSGIHVSKRIRRSDDEDEEEESDIVREAALNVEYGIHSSDIQAVDRRRRQDEDDEVNEIEQEERRLHDEKIETRSRRSITDPNEFEALCKVAPMLGGEGPRATSDANVLFRDHNGDVASFQASHLATTPAS